MGFIDFFYTDQTFYRPMHKKKLQKILISIYLKSKQKKIEGGAKRPPLPSLFRVKNDLTYINLSKT